jgi:hypothetical protein
MDENVKQHKISLKINDLNDLEKLIAMGYEIDINELTKTKELLTERFILKHIDKFVKKSTYLDKLCQFQYRCFSERFILKYFVPLKIFESILCNQKVSEKFIINHIIPFRDTFIDSSTLSSNIQSSLNFWEGVSKQQLSEKFIIKYQEKLNWKNISEYQKLSKDFISKYYHRYLNFYYLSRNVNLTEEIIEEFKNDLYWDQLSLYQNFSLDFLIKHKKTIKQRIEEFKSNKNTPEKIKRDFLNFLELIGEESDEDLFPFPSI